MLAIFAASLAGSVHCVGMCGGLMLSATGPKMRYQMIYHGFRWLAYMSMGAIAGLLGDELFELRWIPAQILVSVIFALLLFSKIPGMVSSFGVKLGYRVGDTNPAIKAALIGFFTVFLPCGWLYSFVLLALATHQLLMGALVLTVFWLGTVPAMLFSRVIMQTIFARIGVSGKRLVTAIMIAAALFSMVEHWKQSFVVKTHSDQEVSCH